MSVSLPHRSVSRTEFLDKLYKLNVTIGGLMAKMPAKYRPNYGDQIVKNGLNAMKYAMTANGIYISIKTPLPLIIQRIELLDLARGCVSSLPTIYQMYISIYIHNNRFSPDKIETLHKSAQRLGEICSECIALLSGVLNYDRKRYRTILYTLQDQNIQLTKDIYQEYYNKVQNLIAQSSNIVGAPEMPKITITRPDLNIGLDLTREYHLMENGSLPVLINGPIEVEGCPLTTYSNDYNKNLVLYSPEEQLLGQLN